MLDDGMAAHYKKAKALSAQIDHDVVFKLAMPS
jgi:hypothetical protein